MGLIGRGIENGLNDFRDDELVAQEKADAQENNMSTRIVDSTLDMAGQLLMVSELSIRMQYNNKMRDAQSRNDSVRRADMTREVDRDNEGRRPDLEYRTEALKDRVASPSNSEYQSMF